MGVLPVSLTQCLFMIYPLAGVTRLSIYSWPARRAGLGPVDGGVCCAGLPQHTLRFCNTSFGDRELFDRGAGAEEGCAVSWSSVLR